VKDSEKTQNKVMAVIRKYVSVSTLPTSLVMLLFPFFQETCTVVFSHLQEKSMMVKHVPEKYGD